MRHVRSAAKLLVVGKPDPDAVPYVGELNELVFRHGLQDRVTIISEWVDEKRKAELFSNCLAAAYFPLDEDSYGYPSLEAHHSRKAVLTTSDSGGTLELVKDGENGFITDPSPEAIAVAIDRLYEDRARAKRMGEAGIARLDELGISWDHVIERLLA